MALNRKPGDRLTPPALALAMAGLAFVSSTPARADFLDGVRKTFTNDLPHFFQDDIPCAFGGQPTSHTRQSCKSDKNAGAPVKAGQGKTNTTSSGR
jgi:hypothetical protein